MGVSGMSWLMSAWDSAFGWGVEMFSIFFARWVSLTPMVLTLILSSIVLLYLLRLRGNKGARPAFWGVLLGSAIALLSDVVVLRSYCGFTRV